MIDIAPSFRQSTENITYEIKTLEASCKLMVCDFKYMNASVRLIFSIKSLDTRDKFEHSRLNLNKSYYSFLWYSFVSFAVID